MIDSQIQWTDATWNIARGCSKVNDDCKYCYMMRDGDRYKYDAKKVIRTKTVFNMPLKYKEVSSSVWPGDPLIFTSSLTDFFHEDCDSFRWEAWNIIRKSPHLIFQILTKRPERVKEHLPFDWGDGWKNVWLGVSAGNQKNADEKIHELLQLRAKTKFLSLEPLTGSIDLQKININIQSSVEDYFYKEVNCLDKYFLYDTPYKGAIDWVIVGGESGNDNGKWRYRPCQVKWISDIVSQCQGAGVPVFVKQLGTHISKELGLKDRHGGNISEFPIELRVRQFPKNKVNVLTL